jgi:hypothetical protein
MLTVWLSVFDYIFYSIVKSIFSCRRIFNIIIKSIQVLLIMQRNEILKSGIEIVPSLVAPASLFLNKKRLCLSCQRNEILTPTITRELTKEEEEEEEEE